MSYSFLNDSQNKITKNRLDRVQSKVRALTYSTKEEYVAELTSLVNGVLSQDYQMQELVTITPETPAVVGDITENFSRLNEDAGDLAEEIIRLEDNASVLYNLAAANQNSIRQQIREQIYQNTGKRFVEQFINKNNIDKSTVSVDLNCGVAQLPLIAEIPQAAQITIGNNSIGSTTDPVSNLSDNNIETRFHWNGAYLELIFTFTNLSVCNRISIKPDDYKGYQITSLSSSPDGFFYEDILQSIGVTNIVMDGTSGKYSGAVVIDFPPKSVNAIRLILENKTDTTGITLRDISLLLRSFQSSGVLNSTAQKSPTGQVLFSAVDKVFSPYVSITYQVSSDSVHYTTIQPGVVQVAPVWWYRAVLSRSNTAFTDQSTPVLATTSDPQVSSGFILNGSSSVPLSPSTVERTLNLANVTGPIPLRDTPIQGTLRASIGTLYLTNSDFSIDSNNVVTFAQSHSAATLSYQTSAQGAQSIAALQQYYTPLLYGISFTQQ